MFFVDEVSLKKNFAGEKKFFAETSSTIRWHIVETSSTKSSPCVDDP